MNKKTNVNNFEMYDNLRFETHNILHKLLNSQQLT